jgi:DNA-directed RNA polymerase sigma subunit (sigma70/sigma32)
VVIEVNGPMQLWQIGAHFGVTKQRIKQILLIALPKLKREFLNRGLSFEDFLQEGNSAPAKPVGQSWKSISRRPSSLRGGE